ncbi:hypothetical protein [Chryseobacterium daeguense]|nr:hypothetical protein [Chryseobacterium daeguense]
MNANIKKLLSIFLLGGMAAQGNGQAVGTPYIPMIDIPSAFFTEVTG